MSMITSDVSECLLLAVLLFSSFNLPCHILVQIAWRLIANYNLMFHAQITSTRPEIRSGTDSDHEVHRQPCSDHSVKRELLTQP